MNRLQKKCFIVASGLHLLLASILLIGPAFLTSSSKPEDVQMIEILPDILTDSQAQGGGSPKGGAPTPVPLPPQPTPTVAPPTPAPVIDKLPTPEPPKPPKVKPQEVTPPKDDPTPTEPAHTTKPKIVVSTTPIIRNTDAKAAAQARAAAEAKAQAEQNRRIAAALSGAASRIAGGVSQGTDIKLSSGFGGGGPSYGNWLSAIKKIYTDAWIVPDGVTDDSATVTATVTIARNGDVLSSSIVRASGSPLVDHSVKATLDRVTTTRPLPDGAKEDQRTVTINFNVKAKLGLG